MTPMPITTPRLVLRAFTCADLDAFSALHADPVTMHDLGGPIPPAAAADKLARYITAYATHGFGRMAVLADDQFLGYVGVMPRGPDHPLGDHAEIGWRLLPVAWGRGLATEAARACLARTSATTDLAEILSYTAPDNTRSQAVMARLGLTRDATRDFDIHDPVLGRWCGLVWTTGRARITTTGPA